MRPERGEQSPRLSLWGPRVCASAHCPTAGNLMPGPKSDPPGFGLVLLRSGSAARRWITTDRSFTARANTGGSPRRVTDCETARRPNTKSDPHLSGLAELPIHESRGLRDRRVWACLGLRPLEGAVGRVRRTSGPRAVWRGPSRPRGRLLGRSGDSCCAGASGSSDRDNLRGRWAPIQIRYYSVGPRE